MVPSAVAMGSSPVILTAGSMFSADPLARAYDWPCTLTLEVPVLHFTVGTLLELVPGAIVHTAAQHNEDISLHVNGQIVGLAEFDVLGDRLAVRLTGVA